MDSKWIPMRVFSHYEKKPDIVKKPPKVKKKKYVCKLKNFIVDNQPVKICRICLAPEDKVKFHKLFDPNENFAADLYYLSSVAVRLNLFSGCWMFNISNKLLIT
jgi:hypothetical protein